jgi:hypothetical protein
MTQLEMEINRDAPSKIKKGSVKGLDFALPFDMMDRWDLVFETFARRYKAKQGYYQIDEFLFTHDIVSDRYKEMMQQGTVHKEVVRHSRSFEESKLLREIHRKLYHSGYRFAGFSREFVNVGNSHRDYKTVAMVYEVPGQDTDSIRVVYDNKFHKPFIVWKHFEGPARIRLKGRYQNNPVRLLVQNKSWAEIDDRTGKRCEYKVHMPSDDILSQVWGAKAAYQRYLARFRR